MEQRLRAILQSVEAEAGAWAERLADATNAEGRPVAGGWPGTISEARFVVARCAAGGPHPVRVTQDELELLTRRAYVVAKAAWRQRTESVPHDDPHGA